MSGPSYGLALDFLPLFGETFNNSESLVVGVLINQSTLRNRMNKLGIEYGKRSLTD